MKIKTVYRYKHENLTIDSLFLPEDITDWNERYRLVAEENKLLTNDEINQYTVVDIEQNELDLWHEIDRPIEIVVERLPKRPTMESLDPEEE